MQPAGKHLIILVTAPNIKAARHVAQAALKAKLAACANLVPKIESHYWWQGKLESSNEILILFKTSASKVAALEKVVLANHPYETPEFVALTISKGNKKYLDWIGKSVG